MKKAIVNISFDDGRQDNLKAIYEVLIPRGLASTVNITTGYVDGSCNILCNFCKTDQQDVAVLFPT